MKVDNRVEKFLVINPPRRFHGCRFHFCWLFSLMYLCMQCDQTFCEKNVPIFLNIAQNGALLNKSGFPKKFLVKVWEFLDKQKPKF
jgi:hypothetical protein